MVRKTKTKRQIQSVNCFCSDLLKIHSLSVEAFVHLSEPLQNPPTLAPRR